MVFSTVHRSGPGNQPVILKGWAIQAVAAAWGLPCFTATVGAGVV